MSRLYAVESLFTLTGASAIIGCVFRRVWFGEIASAILATISGSPVPVPTGVDAKWISECVKDLRTILEKLWSLLASANRLKFICSRT